MQQNIRNLQNLLSRYDIHHTLNKTHHHCHHALLQMGIFLFLSRPEVYPFVFSICITQRFAFYGSYHKSVYFPSRTTEPLNSKIYICMKYIIYHASCSQSFKRGSRKDRLITLDQIPPLLQIPPSPTHSFFCLQSKVNGTYSIKNRHILSLHIFIDSQNRENSYLLTFHFCLIFSE